MNRNPQEEIEEIEEEEDDYVTVPACTVEKVGDRPDQRSLCFSQYFLPIAVCWLILLVIMGLRIYYLTAVNQELETERNDLRGQIQNTSQAQWIIDEYCPKVNNDLTAVNQELETERNDLRGQIQNTSQAQWIIDEYCPKVNNDLTAVNQELETERNDLRGQIQNTSQAQWIIDEYCPKVNNDLTAVNQELETERNILRGPIQNISRAQWSIDEYCPKENNVSERQCRDCQKGWMLIKSSCYLINDPPDLKTWEEAREDCRARSSDLVVVDDEDEQIVLHWYSRYGGYGRYGSWIGLRAEGGRWKWIDGSDLTESVSYWIDEPPPPTDGQCAIFYKYSWISRSCAERYTWICQKKPLSV
ncbi:asialoglycoprotein receptor 1-like isoform X2 [Perca fluviatilis]|uniref:asialoglycoprotein receptor 1-like isoform X2 n=1 Tax=Perca fluviatilis TaxID=8168 RepID=UPI001962688F|nr:asialoglycoprotein receptor 1-like isoform X2 [Perca fluviatilis]